jgi:type I restriction-modification system DNA methylase subunit
MIVRTTVKSIQDIMRQDVGVDGDAQRISQLTWLLFLKIIDDQDQELELTRDVRRHFAFQIPVARIRRTVVSFC